MNFNYRPLSPLVFLGPSDIEGTGVFAKDYIPENFVIGPCHLKTERHGLWRGPLGAFVNHSETPNCMIVTVDEVWQLWTTDEIFPNHELLVDYRLTPECGY